MGHIGRCLGQLALIFGLVLGIAGCPIKAAKNKVAELEQGLSQCQAKIQVMEGDEKVLDFRAMLAFYDKNWGGSEPIPRRFDPPLSERDKWNQRLRQWQQEGYNAVLWWGEHELFGGKHALLELKDFPEARELPLEQVEKNRQDMRWVLKRSKELGMKNILYVTMIHYTSAFAEAHGLNEPMGVSQIVHVTHHNSGVRNELTRAYTESLFAEMAQTYTDLDGFYGSMGESVPGVRSTWFSEAVVPGLKRSGRDPLFIALQWQHKLEEYLEYIAPKTVYENKWLGLHAYNSEQITDAKPWPFITQWAEETGLPTVVQLYAANIYNFPFNSPEFAAEIAAEIKRIPNIKGFVYTEWTGRKLSPLFRKSLAYYTSHTESYSDQPWVRLLEEQFGDLAAAKHFLKAWNLTGRIIPETCALIYCPHDNWVSMRREVRLPYLFMTGDWQPYSWCTSRVRARPLQPIWNYARWVARNPAEYKDNTGWSVTRSEVGSYSNHRQIAVWRTEGGPTYDILPLEHMAKIRLMGEQALQEAEKGIKTIKRNKEQASELLNWIMGYQLLSSYYEKKVKAAIDALIYRKSGDEEYRKSAEKLADEALESYLTIAQFMQKNLNPIMNELYGENINSFTHEHLEIPALIEREKQEREKIGEIFKWPELEE